MHPAYEGLSGMPFYDEFDLSTVDVLLISQYVLSSSLRLLRFWLEVWPRITVSVNGGRAWHAQVESCTSETMEFICMPARLW
jgi:hypothetical protein